MEEILNGVIVDGKVYIAEMSHPDCLALCTMCDLRDYCENTGREICSAISDPTDHFVYSQPLTDMLMRRFNTATT